MHQKKYTTGYIKFLRQDEFKKIRNYVEEIESPSMKMCLKVMMYMGLRVGEATRLKRDNFSNDFLTLTYPKLKSDKIHRREVPSKLANELKLYYRHYFWKMKERYMFYASYKNQSKNQHLQRSTVAYKFMDIRKKLQLEDVFYTTKNGMPLYRVSPHTLRHYAVWRYYAASGNCLKTAQEMIGHVKIDTTAKYINALGSSNREREIIEKAF